MAMSEAQKKAYRQEYYRKNRERILREQKERDSKRDPKAAAEYRKGYYEQNKPKLLERQRERNQKNYRQDPAAHRARADRWKTENPERYAEIQRENRVNRREEHRVASAEWYRDNKATAKEQTRIRKLASYGLTPETYQELSESQDHVCAICGSPYGLESQKHPLYVDHCHETGKVRGLLCSHCNAGLGHFRDNPELLMEAARYLTRSSSGATSTTNKPPSSEPSKSVA